MTNHTSSSTKRSKTKNQSSSSSDNLEYQQLLPGLPDHLAQLCLIHVKNPSLLFSTCHSWRRLIYSPSFPPFLSLYALLSPKNNQTHLSNSIQFSSFDPISSSWIPLPPPPVPSDPPLFLLRHPSFLSRELPIQSTIVSDHLIILAGTTNNLLPALSRPLIFDPLCNRWRFGPQITNPRRWCAAGSVGGAVYIISGVGSHYNREVAQSAEKLNFLERESSISRERKWEKISPLRDGRFSREAVEAVGWKGKICMVNVKNSAIKEGAIYDVEKDLWEEMPQGILIGWNGPAASMDEDEIYTVDQGKGILRKYNLEFDVWEDVIQSTNLRGAVQITARDGKVCVVCGGGGGEIVVIDVVAKPVRMWVLEPPPELQVVAVHVLPRLSRSEF